MSKVILSVSVDDGKYTVEQDLKGRVQALRHGEQWRDCTGDSLILALAQEVEDLSHRKTKTAMSMGYSMDGLRKNIVRAHNDLIATIDDADENCCQRVAMQSLTQNIGVLLCLFDNDVKDDFNVLHDVVTLDELKTPHEDFDDD